MNKELNKKFFSILLEQKKDPKNRPTHMWPFIHEKKKKKMTVQ